MYPVRCLIHYVLVMVHFNEITPVWLQIEHLFHLSSYTDWSIVTIHYSFYSTFGIFKQIFSASPATFSVAWVCAALCYYQEREVLSFGVFVERWWDVEKMANVDEPISDITPVKNSY